MKLKDSTILIVEDDDDFRSSLCHAFHQSGCSTIEAVPDSHKALWAIDQNIFDLIITDYKLPGMDGLRLMAQIKKSSLNSRTPVIIMSGYIRGDPALKLLENGAVAVVTKPFKINDFSELVKEKIGQKKDVANFDAQTIKCFVAGTRDLFEYYFRDKISIGKPVKKSQDQGFGTISAVLGFTGNHVSGSLALTLDDDLLEQVRSKMFPEIDDVDTTDLAGELINQILGKIKPYFTKIGLKIATGLPQVVTGVNHFIRHKLNADLIAIPIEHGGGKGTIELTMTKSANSPVPEAVAEAEEYASNAEGAIFFEE